MTASSLIYKSDFIPLKTVDRIWDEGDVMQKKEDLIHSI